MLAQLEFGDLPPAGEERTAALKGALGRRRSSSRAAAPSLSDVATGAADAGTGDREAAALSEGWAAAVGRAAAQCASRIVEIATRHPLCGARAFGVLLLGSEGGEDRPVVLAMDARGITVANSAGTPETQVPYEMVKEFGLSAGDFRLWYKAGEGRRQLLFKMASELEMNEATRTIAACINNAVRQGGICCPQAQISQLESEYATLPRSPPPDGGRPPRPRPPARP